MKKCFVLLSSLIALFCACNKEKETTETEEFVSVGLIVKTENVSFDSEYPLSRDGTENPKIYGLQIEECDNISDTWPRHSYCYALLDNIQDIVINFRKNKRYMIRVDYFPNGKNEIAFKGTEYGSPFQRFPSISHSEPIPFNKIIYDTEDGLYCIHDMGIHTISSSPYSAGTDCLSCHFERYVYTNWNFIPKDDSPLEITLSRAVGGLTFNFEKVDGFEYSNIIVEIASVQYPVNFINESSLVIPVLTLWGSHDYSETTVDLVSTKASIGTEENKTEIFYGDIEIKRNTMRVYSVKLQPESSTHNPLSITEESNEMGTEEKGILNPE